MSSKHCSAFRYNLTEAEQYNLRALRRALRWLNDCDDPDWWLRHGAHYELSAEGKPRNIRPRHGSEVLIAKARELACGN